MPKFMITTDTDSFVTDDTKLKFRVINGQSMCMFKTQVSTNSTSAPLLVENKIPANSIKTIKTID